MSELEITKLCAEAMEPPPTLPGASEIWGVSIQYAPERKISQWVKNTYNPLTNDAQAMALVKKFRLNIAYIGIKETNETRAVEWWCMDVSQEFEAPGDTPNRAICECVANMQKPLP